MPAELYNKRDCYPFDVQQFQLAEGALAVVRSIGCLQLCVCNKQNASVRAYLKRVTSTEIFFDIQGCQVRADASGKLVQSRNSNQNITFIAENSYVVYDNPSKDGYFPSQMRGTYNLPLLQEIFLYVPSGLTITCIRHQLQPQAQKHSHLQGIRTVYKNAIKFLEGFNCDITKQESSLVFAAGAALGKGIVSNATIKQQLGYQYIPKAVTYKGLRYINGIYPAINFGSTTGLDTKVQPENATGTVIIKIASRGQ